MRGVWRLYRNDNDFEVDLEFLANGRFRYYSDQLNESGEWTLGGTALTLECKDWNPPKRVYEKQGADFAATIDGGHWTLEAKADATD